MADRDADRPIRHAKPCPFCGSRNLATPPGQAVVVCGDCEAAGPFGTPHPTKDVLTELAACAKWNNRVTAEAVEEKPDG